MKKSMLKILSIREITLSKAFEVRSYIRKNNLIEIPFTDEEKKIITNNKLKKEIVTYSKNQIIFEYKDNSNYRTVFTKYSNGMYFVNEGKFVSYGMGKDDEKYYINEY